MRKEPPRRTRYKAPKPLRLKVLNAEQKRSIEELSLKGEAAYSGLPSGCTRESFHGRGTSRDPSLGKEVTAMRPYWLDLRERIAAAVDRHEGSIRGIARLLGIG